MSGLVKSIKKAFKKVAKEIGRVVDKVVDVVKDVADSDIFKVVAVVAAVWFTAGMASAYFAGPTAGSLGASAAASATNMYTTTTAFFGAEAATAGVTESAATLEGMAAAAPEVAVGAVNTGEAVAALQPYGAYNTTAASTVGGSTSGAYGGVGGIADVAGADALSLAGGTQAAGGFTPTIMGGGGGALDIGMAAGGLSSSAPVGMMGWLEANPMAQMMLGQGVMGAAQGYSADKSAERIQDAEDERLKNRGLMGFDYNGKRQGVVASQQTPEQAVAEPDAAKVAAVPQQEVTPQTVQTPVPKDQLPKLLENGQLA